MAQTNYVAAPKVKPLDVSKYVNEEQAARIAGIPAEGLTGSANAYVEAVDGSYKLSYVATPTAGSTAFKKLIKSFDAFQGRDNKNIFQQVKYIFWLVEKSS